MSDLPRIDVWEVDVAISAPLAGSYSDWPANVQDRIGFAIEKQCKPKPGWHVKIIKSACYRDDPQEPWRLRVTVQEFPPTVRH